MLKKNEVNFQTLNIGSGGPLKIKVVAFNVRHYYADIKKVKRILKWKPEIKFQIGILDVKRWGELEKLID